MKTRYVLFVCGVSLCATSPALAQRVEDNAVADAQEAQHRPQIVNAQKIVQQIAYLLTLQPFTHSR